MDVGSVELAAAIKDSLTAGDHTLGKIWVNYSAGLQKPYVKEKPTSSIYFTLSGAVDRPALEQYMSRFGGIMEIRLGASIFRCILYALAHRSPQMKSCTSLAP